MLYHQVALKNNIRLKDCLAYIKEVCYAVSAKHS
jgi:hypothetical protein